MSAFLLDTNVVIALINRTEKRLPRRIADVLGDPAANLIASVVSPWEISIKHAAGKLDLIEPVEAIGDILSAMGVVMLDMTLVHAIEVAYPEPRTRDPFDRLLLAVCACEGMKLLTTDTHLQGHRLVY